MKVVNEAKTRRPRRSKADIESAILRAAVSQIKKKGFSMALVTDIVKRAKIEPIVFYNRYKNLEEFYDTFVKKYDYWLSDMLHGCKGTPSTEDGYANVFESLLRNLIADNIMTELLRWEVTEGTPITERTARLREIDSNALTSKYGTQFESKGVDVVALSTLIIGGIYYMVLHKDRSTFGGIDINTPEGLERIVKALHQQAHILFQHEETDQRRKKMAQCLAQEGLSDEAIQRCLEKTFAV